MKQILLEQNKYGIDFRSNYIPQVLIKLISKDLNDFKYNYMFSYIKDNYNITKKQIITLIKKNLEVHKLLGKTVIYFNNNIYIDKDIKLISILELIDSGNMSIRGTNIFTNNISYILNNKNNLYKYYRVKKNAKKERRVK